ncbi:MAG: hypothetical protein HOO91_19135 [Bacteroidales bacterium]|nr:hypothetical protein [Bacteroidales bacterium]
MKNFKLDSFSHMLFKRKTAIICLTVALTGLIIACGTALYIPTEGQITSSVSIKDLLDGRALYINKCGNCHSLVVPEKHTTKDWNIWVSKMETKAKITPREKELILGY